jgi:hypothetical protein
MGSGARSDGVKKRGLIGFGACGKACCDLVGLDVPGLVAGLEDELGIGNAVKTGRAVQTRGVLITTARRRRKRERIMYVNR